MGWIILLSVVLGAAVIGFVLTRTTNGERRRSAQWNDLHARGRLFTSQLTHLRQVEDRRIDSDTPQVPRGGSAKKARFPWRRRTSASRDAGASPSDPHAPA
jgi:hypothetical protein